MRDPKLPRSPQQPRLLFLISEDWYFWSHRLEVARAAQRAGFEVLLATRVGELAEQIAAEGIRLIPLEFPRGGRNPLKDFATLRRITRIYREFQPDIVHHVSVKCSCLGTWAARRAGVPAIVNAFAGMGYVFVADGWKARLARPAVTAMLRWTLGGLDMPVILQNEEDLHDVVRSQVVPKANTVLIRGAGVDTLRFSQQPEPAGEPIVMMAARMLWSKGVAEFVASARQLRAEGQQARFVAVGRVDKENPNHVPAEQLQAWQREGHIEWWGNRHDMPDVLAQATVVCLPTFYGEGLPKVLLEAAACGKPMVATDIRGCREICRHDVNGLLIPPRDSSALAGAVRTLLAGEVLRRRFGAAGRAIVLKEFTAERIAQQTVDLYRSLADRSNLRLVTRRRAA